MTISIEAATDEFLSIYERKNADKTAHAYRAALEKFKQVLELNHVPLTSPIKDLDFGLVDGFMALLQEKDEQTDENILTVATERLYLTAFRQFVTFVAAEEYANINVIRILNKIKLQRRTEGRRIPDVDVDAVQEFLDFVEAYQTPPDASPDQVLRDQRDRGFIFTLAKGGFRVEEACELKRGSIHFPTRKVKIIGKGDKEAVVRINKKTVKYLKEYQKTRQELDGRTGKRLEALPLFARHDRGAGKKIKPITTTTGRAILEYWVDLAKQASKDKKESFLKDTTSPIRPHTLRHYYVTMVYMATGDLKLAQELARHESTVTTERYTHLVNKKLDAAYQKTFEVDD